MPNMNDEQLLRYSRQILLPDVDVDGQEKLLQASVLIIGLGGLGSPVAMYLAAAGVGELILVDDDAVELSNLQRQIIHTTESLGQSKVSSAACAIKKLNPDIKTIAINRRLQAEELTQQIATVDAVVDCSDNFSTRFAVNKACVSEGVPLISGAAIRLEGQIAVFDTRLPHSPCYRCLYDEQDDEQLNCATSGVLAPLVGVIGAMQALEAIKVLCGFGAPLIGKLQCYDARYGQWREIKLLRDEQCPDCSHRASAD